MKSKKLLFLAIIPIILIGLYLIPFLLYERILQVGVTKSYLNLAPKDNFLKGIEYLPEKFENEIYQDDFQWKEFHFSDFVMPFPLHHPIFRLIPIIEKKSHTTNLGAKFIDPKDRKSLEFKILDKKEPILPIDKQRLFSIPIFKNYILAYPREKMIEDLFVKNLFLFDVDTHGLMGVINGLWKTSYKHLVYNLFIYQMREDFFPTDTMKIFFYKEKKLGIILLPSDNELYQEEIIYILSGKELYSLIIKTRKYEQIARKFRKKLVDNLSFKRSYKDMAREIYQTYKNLGHHKKVDQEGITYLFAAWSHDRENEWYLGEMIRFLERGKKNFIHLSPLYRHVLKHEKNETQEKDKGERTPADDELNPSKEPHISKPDNKKKAETILESVKKSGIDIDRQMDDFQVE